MSLFEQISEDIKSAMKSKEKDKLEALRAVKTAFIMARSEKGATAILSEDEELKIIQRLIKQRKESAEIYKSQNRDDLCQKEIIEAEAISAYLPKQVSDTELVNILKEIISRVNATGIKDMGKVMAVASKELSGKADGKVIAEKVKMLLNG